MARQTKQTSGDFLQTTSFLSIFIAFTGIFPREFTMPGPSIWSGMADTSSALDCA